MGKGAHGDAIVTGKFFAVELLGGGALAEGLELEAPEVVGAERFYECIDIGIETVDGGGDEDDGGYADGDAEDGEAGAQLVLAQGFQRHFYGFFGVAESHEADYRLQMTVGKADYRLQMTDYS